ncbi:TPA: hypothetical protein OHP48_004993 [Escherichia coli]|uniref:Uncharacterized protein n=2 Tax=Escherichia coli TaxID=562 RepID=A0A1X3IYC7_ECOLX|nr:hypothetical protein [Escherichia coli]EKM2128258.1 hypothetical protein [Escherichia coli O157]EET9020271.1 hypothetical protein [Escherichia coli]EEU0924265.1 hypothetical protein [Escherichia coli]EEX8847207.1 hypothetical protein [Escherichia coli]EEX9499067.1 hypothetical protein [Escherichia coli]
MLNYHDNTRSMQTIRTNTAVIDSFPMRIHNSEDAVEVRRMLCRESADRQHFIVTFKSDIAKAEEISNSTSLVTPLAEVVVRNNKLRFVLKPQEQYPEIADVKESIVPKIESAVVQYMKNMFNELKESVLPERQKEQWHLL